MKKVLLALLGALALSACTDHDTTYSAEPTASVSEDASVADVRETTPAKGTQTP